MGCGRFPVSGEGDLLKYLVIALVLLTSNAAAQRSQRQGQAVPPPATTTPRPQERVLANYGPWRVSEREGYLAAYTTNESGSTFGMLCGTTCTFYLAIQLQCNHGEQYPAMLNSSEGAHPLRLRCVMIDGVPVMSTDSTDPFISIVTEGQEVGFAVPLQSGRFGVSRFSMRGAYEAVNYALTVIEQMRGQDQDGLRDFTI